MQLKIEGKCQYIDYHTALSCNLDFFCHVDKVVYLPSLVSVPFVFKSNYMCNMVP